MLRQGVTLRAGHLIERGDMTVVPLCWQAPGKQGVSTALSADLEIAPLSANMSELTLRGSYAPPLGTAGRRLDRLRMHQIAETTIRSFMRQLADRLSAHAAAGVEPRRDTTHALDLPPAVYLAGPKTHLTYPF